MTSKAGKWLISRRTALRGIGATLALPLLEAMAGSGGIARAAEAVAGAAAPAQAPLRMATFFLPNGVWLPNWKPTKEGADFDLPPTLEPLAPFKDHLLVLSGLTQDAARAHGDGGGDHARSASAFLTGIHPRKGGNELHLGVSMDQLAARKAGEQTRFPSLELGLERGGSAGECDTGYSCAYSNNISWQSETSPMPKEV